MFTLIGIIVIGVLFTLLLMVVNDAFLLDDEKDQKWLN